MQGRAQSAEIEEAKTEGVNPVKKIVKFTCELEHQTEIDLPFYFKWNDTIIKQFDSYHICISQDNSKLELFDESLDNCFTTKSFKKDAIVAIKLQYLFKNEFERRYAEFKKHVEGIE
jgi:hypothetical protein